MVLLILGIVIVIAAGVDIIYTEREFKRIKRKIENESDERSTNETD